LTAPVRRDRGGAEAGETVPLIGRPEAEVPAVAVGAVETSDAERASRSGAVLEVGPVGVDADSQHTNRFRLTAVLERPGAASCRVVVSHPRRSHPSSSNWLSESRNRVRSVIRLRSREALRTRRATATEHTHQIVFYNRTTIRRSRRCDPGREIPLGP